MLHEGWTGCDPTEALRLGSRAPWGDDAVNVVEDRDFGQPELHLRHQQIAGKCRCLRADLPRRHTVRSATAIRIRFGLPHPVRRKRSRFGAHPRTAQCGRRADPPGSPAVRDHTGSGAPEQALAHSRKACASDPWARRRRAQKIAQQHAARTAARALSGASSQLQRLVRPCSRAV